MNRITPLKTPRKNKRSHSRSTQHKRDIATQAQQEYTTEDVLQAAQDFLGDQKEAWVNFSTLAQHMYERFYKLNPRYLGEPENRYSSLLKFIANYTAQFNVRQDNKNKGVYWIYLRSYTRLTCLKD